ncbi:MAG TPA: hypothetical protein PK177_17130, partial [Burkholderiaceae bacterium]|nr:hypothetical protein [Burkholderiaceae bacterium]
MTRLLMKRFITPRFAVFGRRAGHVVIVVALLAVGTFSMLELLPGNLADSLLGDNAAPEEISRIEAELGLDHCPGVEQPAPPPVIKPALATAGIV